MNWWEETEARAHRSRTPATLAQTLWQRLQAAGVDLDLAMLPAYDMAQLYELCIDLVKLVDGLLLTADGDKPALRRQGRLLLRWSQGADHWWRTTASEFNRLMDSLELDADALAGREAEEEEVEADPEEQAKVDGRYRNWHLLYERLDLKLAAADVEAHHRRSLARALARLFEECLVTIRLLDGLFRESTPHFRPTARLLLQVNTTWHFDLGPYHLGSGELRAKGGASLGLQTLLFLSLQSL